MARALFQKCGTPIHEHDGSNDHGGGKEDVECDGLARDEPSEEDGNGCATYKWKLSRPACLPVVFKLTIQMAAAESQDRVGSSNGPEHS